MVESVEPAEAALEELSLGAAEDRRLWKVEVSLASIRKPRVSLLVSCVRPLLQKMRESEASEAPFLGCERVQC